MTLRISNELELPLEAITSTSAILAIRGVGKTVLAKGMAEDIVAAGHQFVAIDPTDAWWGLRAAADGSPSGLPVVIFDGGGDV